jgi:hypothetical protein
MKRLDDSIVAEMHRDYASGMALAAVARKHGRNRRSIREIFERRGLALREEKKPKVDPKTGRVLPYVPATPERITALIEQVTHVAVPAELRHEWRHWTMVQRGEFIRRMRLSLKRRGLLRTERPNTPFSANVEPFDYTTPRARDLVTRMNIGRTSQTKATQLKPCSEGVIWNEKLWFWVPYSHFDGHGGSYQTGRYIPGLGRPELHRVIWSEANGRPVPPQHCVRFIDGNPNNLLPTNLRLEKRVVVCRENQAKAITRKAREMTALLLKRSQSKDQNANHELVRYLGAARDDRRRGKARAAQKCELEHR